MNRSLSKTILKGRSFSVLSGKNRSLQPKWKNLKIAPPHIKSPGRDRLLWMEVIPFLNI